MPSNPEQARSDLALVRDFLANRRGAVESMAARLQSVARILASRNARMGRPLGEHDLADLAQDTVVLILNKLHRFEGRAILEAWFCGICHLELLNSIRRSRRQPRQLEQLPEPVQPGSETNPPGLNQEEILIGLESLPPFEADVIRLKLFDDLTFKEIAVQLECSANTSKTRYYRALTKLHDFVKNRYPEAQRD